MTADLQIVLVGRLREGGDADRVRLHLVVEHPDRLEPVLLVVEHGLVDDDQEIALRQWQRVVRSAAERRRPDLVDDQLGVRAILDIDDREAGVAPAAISDVLVDDGVMQPEAAVRRRPVRRLAGGDIHARQPVFAGEPRLGRVGHVDGDQDVVGEAVDQRRGVGPAPADVPEPVQARSFDRHEADPLWLVGLGDIVDGEPRRPVAFRRLGLRMLVDRALVVGLLVGEVGLREHVLVVDDEQQVLVRLQMQAPGVMRGGDVLHRFRVLRIAHVDHRKALREDVPDIGVAAMHHDLHAVRAAALVAIADQAHVLGIVGLREIAVGHGDLPPIAEVGAARLIASTFARAKGGQPPRPRSAPSATRDHRCPAPLRAT